MSSSLSYWLCRLETDPWKRQPAAPCPLAICAAARLLSRDFWRGRLPSPGARPTQLLPQHAALIIPTTACRPVSLCTRFRSRMQVRMSIIYMLSCTIGPLCSTHYIRRYLCVKQSRNSLYRKRRFYRLYLACKVHSASKV